VADAKPVFGTGDEISGKEEISAANSGILKLGDFSEAVSDITGGEIAGYMGKSSEGSLMEETIGLVAAVGAGVMVTISCAPRRTEQSVALKASV
jgi:hypothetical protein